MMQSAKSGSAAKVDMDLDFRRVLRTMIFCVAFVPTVWPLSPKEPGATVFLSARYPSFVLSARSTAEQGLLAADV